MQIMNFICTCVILITFLNGYVCQDTLEDGVRSGVESIEKQIKPLEIRSDTKPGSEVYNLKSKDCTLQDQSQYFRLDQETGIIYLNISLSSYDGDEINIVILCTANNKINKLSITFVIVRDTPIISSSPQTTSLPVFKQRVDLVIPDKIENGTNVNFICGAEGFTSEPEFVWFPTNTRDGRISTSGIFNGSVWKSVLKVNPILKRDEETVNCTVRGDNLEIKRTATFTIVVRTPITVVASPGFHGITKGDSVTLNCSVQAQAQPVAMRWYRLNGSEQLVAESQGSVPWFSITVTVTENATFVCEGFDTTQSSRSNKANIYLNEAGIGITTLSPTTTSIQTEPDVKIDLYGPSVIDEGNPANFTCKATGFETQPEFKWSPSGSSSDRVQVAPTSKELPWTSVLQFQHISKSDGDTVTCSVIGVVGLKTYTLTKSISFSTRYPLSVVASPETLSVVSGQLVTLNCSVLPEDQLSWILWYQQNEIDTLLVNSSSPVSWLSYTGAIFHNSTFVCEAWTEKIRKRSNTINVFIVQKVTTTRTVDVDVSTYVTGSTLATSSLSLEKTPSHDTGTSERATPTESFIETSSTAFTDTGSITPVETTTFLTTKPVSTSTVLASSIVFMDTTAYTTTTTETTTFYTPTSATSRPVLTASTINTSTVRSSNEPSTSENTMTYMATTFSVTPMTTDSVLDPSSTYVAVVTANETASPTSNTYTEPQTSAATTSSSTAISSTTTSLPATTTTSSSTTTTPPATTTTTSSTTTTSMTTTTTPSSTTTSSPVTTTSSTTTLSPTTTTTPSSTTTSSPATTNTSVSTTTSSLATATTTSSTTTSPLATINPSVSTTTSSLATTTTTSSTTTSPLATTTTTSSTTTSSLATTTTTPSTTTSPLATTTTTSSTTTSSPVTTNPSVSTTISSSTTTNPTASTTTPSPATNNTIVDERTSETTSDSTISETTSGNTVSETTSDSTISETPSDYTVVLTTSDNTISETTSDNTISETTSDYTFYETTSDYTFSETTSDNTVVQTTSDSTISETISDNTISETTSDNTVVQTTSDSTISETTSDSTISDTTSDNTISETTSDYTFSDTTSDNTVVQTTIDNTVVQTTSDSTISETTSDKTISETTSDNTISETTSDNTVVQTTSDNTISETTSDYTFSETTSDNTVVQTTSDNTVSPSDTTDLTSVSAALSDVTSDGSFVSSTTSEAFVSSTTSISDTRPTTTTGTVKCQEITDEKGVKWNETLSGITIANHCPKHLPGESTRRCQDNGQWDIVKYDNLCRSSTLNRSLEEVSQIEKGLFTGNLGDVFKDLETVVDPEGMTPTRLNEVLVMLSIITDQYRKTDNIVKSQDIQNMVKLADRMLDVDAENWGEDGPKSLLLNIDEMAKLAIRGDPGNRFEQTFFTESIFFQIGSAKDTNIDCPKLTDETPDWVKNMNSSTRVNVESFPEMRGDERVWYSGVIYRNVDALFEKQYLNEINTKWTPFQIRDDMVTSSSALDHVTMKDLVSGVISFNIFPQIMEINPPLYITLELKRTDSKPICSFIEFNETTGIVGNWSSTGCWMETRSNTRVVCACNHTTNFAILMNPFSTEETEHDFVLGVISIVGCAISIIFLLTTIIVYCMVWRHMVKTHVARVKAILLMNLCVTLIISYTLFLAGIRLTDNKYVCTGVAALLHYFFLAVFCVMLAEGIHLFISIVIVINFLSYLKSLFILIWVTPALIVGITIGIVKIDGYTGQRFCWLSTDGYVIWAFVGPALLVKLVNAIILLASLRQMMKRKSWDDKILKQGKYLARALAVILPIIGITWVFGVFAVNRDLVVFQYLFAICNSLQGAFIFIFHCCTSNVKAAFRDMRNRFHRQSLSKSTLKSGSVYRTKSSQESYPSVTSTNSQYHLSLTNKLARNNSDPFEQQGNQIGRVIALPALFDPDFDMPSQILLREDNSSDRGSRSPTSVQQFNLGFTDTRRRVAFSMEYPNDTHFTDYKETPVDPEGETRRRSVSFSPLGDYPEDELERHLRRRRRETDQMYEVCNAFTEMRRSQKEESGAKEKWKSAFNALHEARKFRISPQSSLTPDNNVKPQQEPERYFMLRL